MNCEEKKLSKITIKIGSGATPRGGSNVYKARGVSFIRSQNVLDLKFSMNGLAYIDQVQADLLTNVTVQEEDILLNITGDSIARVCMVPKEILPARVNQHVSIIRTNKYKLNPYFLLYYLIYKKPELLSIAEIGCTRRALTKGAIQKLDICLPTLHEQEVIASVLSSLDNKIDLLHRQNETLESLAETIFRQWFIIKSSSIKIADAKLQDVCLKITSGGTPSTKVHSYYDGNINWYSTKELTDKFLFESDTKITKKGLDNSAAKVFPVNTIVIAIYAAPTVGRMGILSEEASFNQAACGLIVDESKVCFEFIYIYLKLERGNLNLIASGSAQQNLNVEKIKTYPVFIPTQQSINHFKAVVRPMFAKIRFNQLQIRTLETLRDTLLPKLMSGEVRVKYNEDEVEKVV